MSQDSAPGAPRYEHYVIDEVLNYGGFFAGTTVTLYVQRPGESGEARKFIIADHNFENLKGGDRFKVQAGQVLSLLLDGDEVRAARILAAPTRAALRAAIAPAPPVPGHELEPRSPAYECRHCNLWVAGQPVCDRPARVYRCEICGRPLQTT